MLCHTFVQFGRDRRGCRSDHIALGSVTYTQNANLVLDPSWILTYPQHADYQTYHGINMILMVFLWKILDRVGHLAVFIT